MIYMNEYCGRVFYRVLTGKVFFFHSTLAAWQIKFLPNAKPGKKHTIPVTTDKDRKGKLLKYDAERRQERSFNRNLLKFLNTENKERP